jgi:hypothetical protein
MKMHVLQSFRRLHLHHEILLYVFQTNQGYKRAALHFDDRVQYKGGSNRTVLLAIEERASPVVGKEEVTTIRPNANFWTLPLHHFGREEAIVLCGCG